MSTGTGAHAAPIPQLPRAVPLQSLAKFGAGAILATFLGLAAWQIMTREPKTANPAPAIEAATEPFADIVSSAVETKLDAVQRVLQRDLGDLKHTLDREMKGLKADVEENTRQIGNIRKYHDSADKSWRDLDDWQRNVADDIREIQRKLNIWKSPH